MIEKLTLKNFSSFEDLEINFSPKINIIVGENGTGKTQLLKAAHALCSGSTLFKNKPDSSKEDVEAYLTSKLLGLFMPLDDSLGKLHNHKAKEKGSLEAKFAQGKKITTTFFKNSKSVAIAKNNNYDRYLSEPVFIPTKEVLSFMKGFTSLYERYGLSFDQTYQDICLLLDLPEIRPETLHEKSKWVISEIEKICRGKFIFYGGGKVVFKNEDAEYSANTIAEGFRKIGMLSRLIETGAIQPGVSGPLFWDEPESNLNPKLMSTLVEIMLELSRFGQQIVIATHDYVLLKWFDLLMNRGSGDHVSYHSLYWDESDKKILLNSTDDYKNIVENPISEAYDELLIAHAKIRLKGN